MNANIQPEDCSAELDKFLVKLNRSEEKRQSLLGEDPDRLERCGKPVLAGKVRHLQAEDQHERFVAGSGGEQRSPFRYDIKLVGREPLEDYPRGWLLELCWGGDPGASVTWFATRDGAWRAMMKTVSATIPDHERRSRRLPDGFDLTYPGASETSFVRVYRTNGAGIFRGKSRGFGPDIG